MNLHEYQSKQLFAEYGLPLPAGEVARSVQEAAAVAGRLGGTRWVVKAQVHAGGRGKAGGVRRVDNVTDVERAAKQMLGSHLVTHQTDALGQPVNAVLIEQASEIAQELYLGAVIDRAQGRVVFMASTEGGVDIEQVASDTPEKIYRVTVDPLLGLQPYQCRSIGFALGLDFKQIRPLTQIMEALAKLFMACDLSLLEVNPLVVTREGRLLCLDAKVNIDDNALYRQPKLAALRDTSQEKETEVRAREFDLSYVALEGDIGCMVNGAGLAMATMDLIKLHGGQPANFLDVGGGTTQERVAEAFKIILSDPRVKGVLINIFGGIVRCDMIARGIIAAVQEVQMHVPVVVRLAGTNAELGMQMLQDSGLELIPATGLAEAAEKVVSAVRDSSK
jgi:succinyl-CoA synthetase beta subunit